MDHGQAASLETVSFCVTTFVPRTSNQFGVSMHVHASSWFVHVYACLFSLCSGLTFEGETIR